MRLSRQCEVAIDILVLCATKPDETITIGKAALFANTTKDFASQIVMRLVRTGLLKSRRGSKGGIELSRGPDCVSLGEVVREMDNSLSSTRFEITDTKFDQVFQQATQALFGVLDAISIEELADASAPADCPGNLHRRTSGQRPDA